MNNLWREVWRNLGLRTKLLGPKSPSPPLYSAPIQVGLWNLHTYTHTHIVRLFSDWLFSLSLRRLAGQPGESSEEIGRRIAEAGQIPAWRKHQLRAQRPIIKIVYLHLAPAWNDNMSFISQPGYLSSEFPLIPLLSGFHLACGVGGRCLCVLLWL